MASISDPVPLALNLSTTGSKVHASEVLNCKNQAVLAIDGEGLFIHSVLLLPEFESLANASRLHRVERWQHLALVLKSSSCVLRCRFDLTWRIVLLLR
jgi:hypothetical protein